MRFNKAIVSSVLLASLEITQPALANNYTFTDLGTANDEFGVAIDLNNNGQVIGDIFTTIDNGNSFTHRSFFYSDGVAQDLVTSGDPFYPVSINDSGHIVGNRIKDSLYLRASLYNNGNLLDLGDLSGENSSVYYSQASKINNNGLIVGNSQNANYEGRAFLYDNAAMQDLGTLGTGNYSFARSMNNNGQIVGSANIEVNSIKNRAFLYSNGSMQDLGTLPGNDTSHAIGINDSGEIIGYSGNLSGFGADTRSFLYNNGVMQDIGGLSSGFTLARDINNNGQVVGVALNEDGYERAFLYSNGGMQDLNSFLDVTTKEAGWTLYDANAINDNGWIVGQASNVNFTYKRVFLLTPVPEPETYAMLLAGLGLLSVAARRKKAVE